MMTMENNINGRIGELVKALKMSNNAFSKSIGKSASTVNFIIDGRSKPSFDVLEAICDTYPDVNPAWLLKGEGEIWKVVSSPVATPDTYLQSYLEKLEEQFRRVVNQLETKDSQIEVKDRQLESKDRQIERLMDLLGKLNLGGKTPWGKVLPHPATEEMEAA